MTNLLFAAGWSTRPHSDYFNSTQLCLTPEAQEHTDRLSHMLPALKSATPDDVPVSNSEISIEELDDLLYQSHFLNPLLRWLSERKYCVEVPRHSYGYDSSLRLAFSSS